MLKKIPVDTLRVGMYVHAFEGSWLDHSMWATRFALQSAEEVARVRGSGARECWIDLDKGLDVADARPASVAAPPTAPAVTAQPLPGTRIVVPQVPMSEEVSRAAALCLRSQQAVRSMFAEARLGRAIDVDECLPIVHDIANSVLRNAGALVSLARLKNSDDYTYMHSVAVCALMVALGRQLGLDEDACREAGCAGLLHDVGKALMPEAVLNKPGSLSDDEFRIMKSHPERGHSLLEQAGIHGVGALDVCLHHHERFDGSGYPHKLEGERISLFARMGAVCDVYDAITSARAYKAAWEPSSSIQRMMQWTGHFDPAVLQAFVRSIGIYPIGSLVRLESQKLAVVVDQNERSLIAPPVKVFYSLRAQQPVTPYLLDLSRPQCADRIVAREDPAAWGFKRLDELWAGPEALAKRRTA